LLSPLWDFSYRYCIFDNHSSNRIIGFYNLDELDQRIEKIVLHRTKEQVIRHLPKVSYVDLPVPLHPVQIKIQLGLAKELLEILQKKIISQFELQQAVELIRKLRMVADSSFLVDDMTNLSPKTEELKSLLTERLNIRKKRKKVIIFTEWKRMSQVISRVLRLSKIKFVEITDETPEKQRTLSLKSFTTDPDCLVLVSSCATLDESEIKASDIVIHFDIPADRSLKSLRMGSISGIIQRDGNLTCFNLYSKNSIEERLNAGMEINLHEKGKKKETDIPTEIPKLIKSELIETLTDIINQGSEADESIQETLQRDESGQMVINFASEEEISKVQKKSTSELSDFVFSDSLDLDEDKILQTLTNSTSLVAEMLKLATSDKADVQNYSPDFDPENGEILLRFKLLRKA
jgi:superfamily II DNA/RNA helicase